MLIIVSGVGGLASQCVDNTMSYQAWHDEASAFGAADKTVGAKPSWPTLVVVSSSGFAKLKLGGAPSHA